MPRKRPTKPPRHIAVPFQWSKPPETDDKGKPLMFHYGESGFGQVFTTVPALPLTPPEFFALGRRIAEQHGVEKVVIFNVIDLGAAPRDAQVLTPDPAGEMQ